jgi:hypothetical protein
MWLLVCLQRRRAKQAAHTREVERLLAYRRQLYQAMRVSLRQTAELKQCGWPPAYGACPECVPGVPAELRIAGKFLGVGLLV